MSITHDIGEYWEGCCGRPRAHWGTAPLPTPPPCNTLQEPVSKSEQKNLIGTKS